MDAQEYKSKREELTDQLNHLEAETEAYLLDKNYSDAAITQRRFDLVTKAIKRLEIRYLGG